MGQLQRRCATRRASGLGGNIHRFCRDRLRKWKLIFSNEEKREDRNSPESSTRNARGRESSQNKLDETREMDRGGITYSVGRGGDQE